MYNVKSMDANEFIDDGEVLESISEAKKLVQDKSEIERILNKARQYKGLTHREAAVLLEVDDDETLEKCLRQLKRLRRKFTEKELCCLRRFIFLIIVLMTANIAVINVPIRSADISLVKRN